MFEDIQESLAIISERVSSVLAVDYDEINNRNIDAALKTVLSEMLVEAGVEAAKETVEFAYEPLLRRLEENLSNPEHIYIQNGRVVKFFDLDIAGDYSDLMAGVEEAGGHTGTPNAPKIWKYGIYTDAQLWNGGKGSRLYKNLPTYEEVIDERLSAWGDKAPFWYFIEFGNLSYDRAFPQIKPTYFLRKFEKICRKMESLVVDVFTALIQNFIDAEVQDIAVGQIKPGTTVAVSRINIPSAGLRVTKLRSSAGNTFYNINGVRGFNSVEAVRELRRYL